MVPPKSATQTCSSGSGIVKGGSIWSLNYTVPLTAVGAAVGSLLGPEGTLPGALVGSMFGAGGNVSVVPSTGSVYAGPVAMFGLGISGGGGFSFNLVTVPPGQNANSIASGKSFSVTYQPTFLRGATATKSPEVDPRSADFR